MPCCLGVIFFFILLFVVGMRWAIILGILYAIFHGLHIHIGNCKEKRMKELKDKDKKDII